MNTTDLELAGEFLGHRVAKFFDCLPELLDRLVSHGGRRPDEDQPLHTLRRGERHPLSDNASHRMPDHSRPLDSLRVHERDHVADEILKGVPADRTLGIAMPPLVGDVNAPAWIEVGQRATEREPRIRIAVEQYDRTTFGVSALRITQSHARCESRVGESQRRRETSGRNLLNVRWRELRPGRRLIFRLLASLFRLLAGLLLSFLRALVFSRRVLWFASWNGG